jgi:hypothetical protein
MLRRALCVSVVALIVSGASASGASATTTMWMTKSGARLANGATLQAFLGVGFGTEGIECFYTNNVALGSNGLSRLSLPFTTQVSEPGCTIENGFQKPPQSVVTGHLRAIRLTPTGKASYLFVPRLTLGTIKAVPGHEVWCVFGKATVVASFAPGQAFKATNEHVTLGVDTTRSLSPLCPTTFTVSFTGRFESNIATEVVH